jgi:hypothetical protein
MSAEVYEWVLSGVLGGQFVQTVQHVAVDRVGTPTAYAMARLLALTFADESNLIALMCGCLPTDYHPTSIRVKRVLPTGGPTCIVLAGVFATSAGVRTGSISSAQVNPVIVWIPTDHPAKTGRLFLPGVSEADIDEMQLVSGLVTAINDLCTFYQQDQPINDSSEEFHGCVLRKHVVSGHTVPLEGDDIEAGYVSPLIGTQRRRLHPV